MEPNSGLTILQAIYFSVAILGSVLSMAAWVIIRVTKVEEQTAAHEKRIDEHDKKLDETQKVYERLGVVETLLKTLLDRFDRLENRR